MLVANRDKKTERYIVIAIDEPETSMHVSNCFKQFSRLEELADIYKKQVIVTTHWYGFLPIAQSGNMQHIQNEDGNVSISTFSLSNIMESRKSGEVRLFDATIPNTYSQTEMEDCLDKEIYFEALKACIEQSGDDDLISIINCFHLNDEATTSVLKGDCSCIVPNSIEMLKEKSRIISFAEDSANKYAVARKYKELCQEKEEYPQHALKSVIENEWK